METSKIYNLAIEIKNQLGSLFISGTGDTEEECWEDLKKYFQEKTKEYPLLRKYIEPEVHGHIRTVYHDDEAVEFERDENGEIHEIYNAENIAFYIGDLMMPSTKGMMKIIENLDNI